MRIKYISFLLILLVLVSMLTGCKEKVDLTDEFNKDIEAGEILNRKGVSVLPSINGKNIVKSEMVIVDANQSYIDYEGVTEAVIEKLKSSISNIGYGEWMSVKDGNVINEGVRSETIQITLIYSVDKSDTSLRVHMLENLDKLFKED